MFQQMPEFDYFIETKSCLIQIFYFVLQNQAVFTSQTVHSFLQRTNLKLDKIDWIPVISVLTLDVNFYGGKFGMMILLIIIDNWLLQLEHWEREGGIYKSQVNWLFLCSIFWKYN